MHPAGDVRGTDERHQGLVLSEGPDAETLTHVSVDIDPIRRHSFLYLAQYTHSKDPARSHHP
jgi:hypothetical protein